MGLNFALVPTKFPLQDAIAMLALCKDSKLDIIVYCKLTYMDRFLHLRSRHPTHVKKGTIRCLYDCTRCIAQQGQNLKEEENHLMKAFMRNGYPRSFIRFASAAKPWGEQDGEREEDRSPTVHLFYVAGVTERIRRVCRAGGCVETSTSDQCSSLDPKTIPSARMMTPGYCSMLAELWS